MLVNLYKIGKVYFCLLGMNAFHVKVENKDLQLRAGIVVRHSNIEYFVPTFGPLSQKLH